MKMMTLQIILNITLSFINTFILEYISRSKFENEYGKHIVEFTGVRTCGILMKRKIFPKTCVSMFLSFIDIVFKNNFPQYLVKVLPIMILKLQWIIEKYRKLRIPK